MIRTTHAMACLQPHPDHLAWSLPAHRRGTLRGMDAAYAPTGTYLLRVLRWWAGKGPAAKPQIRRSAPNTAGPSPSAGPIRG
ncbi:hypothetical protein XarbCFBP7629_03250 [Xanthomonas arboricola]|nr:hypothetical protein XarbCFBP7629_03250 [Xanthomonas arboricola]